MIEHITKNFTWEEFACHNGIQVPAKYQDNVILLCKQLEIIRIHADAPIEIVCGYRTVAYNDGLRRSDPKVAKNSQHCLGKAAHISILIVNSISLRNLILYLINTYQIIQGGLVLYDTFVHYDIRGTAARWDYSTKY
jgi:uncharacterized protein YcbK (DUF882 family)